MTGDDRAAVGRLLPDYDIGAELGRGQFGVVWAARHRRLDRSVAVKQLSGPVAATAQHAARFRREARILASIDHPHVVTVHDYREEADLRVLVMELLPGGTLHDRTGAPGGDLGVTVAAVLAACCGLHHVHGEGVLHRDVKPANLMFDGRGALKVTDFGLARGEASHESVLQVTRAGDFFGTPAYVAPEQVAGSFGSAAGAVGPAADQYSVAALLYESLSGRLTHESSEGVLSLCHHRLTEEAAPLGAVAPAVPASLVEVVMRGVARDPADRYPSVEGFAVALGAAAHRTLGAGWMERAGLELRDIGAVRAAAEGRRAAQPAVADRPPPPEVGATVRVGPPSAPPPPMPPPDVPLPAPPAGDGATGGPGTTDDERPPRSRRAVRRLVVAAGIALLLVAVAAAVLVLGGGGGSASGGARTSSSGSGSTGRAVGTLPIASAWTHSIGGDVFSSPAVAGDLVVIGTPDGAVIGLDRATGAQRWSTPTEGPVRSSPAVDGTAAYVGSDDGYLYALDLATGSVRWRADLGYQIVSSPALGDGVVVVGADRLYGIDPATGSTRWTADTGDVVVSSPAISGDTVVVGSNDGRIHGVAATDGSNRWTVDLGGQVLASPKVAGGRAFVGAVSGEFSAIDLATGKVVWSRPLDGEVKSSAGLADGKAIVGLDHAGRDELVALDQTGGTVVWKVEVGGRVDSSPLVVGERVVAGDDAGTVSVVGLDDGRVLGRFPTGGPILSSPRLAADLVLVASYDGSLYALRGIVA